MAMNRKGAFGFNYIGLFFLFLAAFLFVILITDIGKVEIFEPAHNHIIDLTENATGNTSVYYEKSVEMWETSENVTLPYNLILIFMTGYLILVSVLDAASQDRKNIYYLLFGTLGGTIFIIYFIHLFLIGILDYFEVEVISYLFADLITSHLPFYNYLLSVWGVFVLLWCIAMALSNALFGKETVE